MMNLISNALKFTREEAFTSWRLSPEPPGQKGTFELSVRDTGIISENIRDDLHPFSQQCFGHHTQEQLCGTGLGLSISRKLAQAMNGRLEIESRENEGSTFTLILDAVDSETNSLNDEEGDKNGATPVVDISLLSSEVLRVDDQMLNLKVLEHMMKREGFSPISVSSAEEAIKVVKNQKIDMIFTDLKMPGMDEDKLAQKYENCPKATG